MMNLESYSPKVTAGILLRCYKRPLIEGAVCIAFPVGHMVWVDDDNTAYDIDGIDITECYYYIPEEYLGNQIINFKHIPHKWVIPATREEMLEIAKKYCADNNIEIDPQLVEELSK